MSSINTTNYLINLLSADTDLKELLEDSTGIRIFPIDALKGTNFPFCVIQRNSIIPQYSKDGNFKDEVDVTVAIVSDKYKQSVNVADKVRKCLEYKKVPDYGIKLITLSGVSETMINDSFLQTLDFKIIF